MKKILITMIATAFATTSFASTCSDLQTAEVKIISAAYYGVTEDTRAYCYFLSRSVTSSEGKKIGLDGLVQSGIEFCVDSESKVSAAEVAKETNKALKAIKGCFSLIGQ